MNARPLTIRDSDSERRVQDPDLLLRIPENDVQDPELSIVIPALNEKVTIAMFVDWCMEGLRKANIRGEVLIIDSSSDETPEIDAAIDAEVIETDEDGDEDPAAPAAPADDLGVDFAEDEDLAEEDDDVPFLEDEDDDGFPEDEIDGLPGEDDRDA